MGVERRESSWSLTRANTGMSAEWGKGKEVVLENEQFHRAEPLCDVVEGLKRFRKEEVPRWEGKLELLLPR